MVCDFISYRSTIFHNFHTTSVVETISSIGNSTQEARGVSYWTFHTVLYPEVMKFFTLVSYCSDLLVSPASSCQNFQMTVEMYRIVFGFFWTLSIVWYVEVLLKTTTFRRLDLSPSSGGWGRVDLLSWARQKELVSICTTYTIVRILSSLSDCRNAMPGVG
jgi:hypothetical protein